MTPVFELKAHDASMHPRRAAVEPYVYLRQVFTDLPDAETVEQVEALLPWVVMNEKIVVI